MLIPVLLAALLTVESPAGMGSAQPNLATTRDGGVLLSWLEPAGQQHALKFSTYRAGRWSAPLVITKREDLIVNWADFPSVIEDARGTLFAHWLQKSEGGKYAYDVWLSASSDGGKTWKKPHLLNRDGKPSEHGFVSMVPLPKGGVAVAWLDGREMTGEDEGGPMTLRYAEVDGALVVTKESVLDARVCECCTTGMAMTSHGALVAYRDRSPDEVRDIAVVRAGGAPKRVHADNWKIAGCPVNGPQLDASGDRVAVAWFTAPGDKPAVNVAFSNDAGATFAKPARVDGGEAAGRVDLLLLKDGSALVTWVEGTSILARHVQPNGRLTPPERLATATAARNTGFPRATLAGTTPWFAWTDVTAKRVRVGRME